jgi:hypothetical protein
MTKIVRVKPAGHNMVRNPDAALRHVDPAGESVEWNAYWARRLEAKEIEIVEDEAPAPKGTQEKK